MGSTVTGLAILGSTGSVGCQALDVVRGLRERFRVVGLAAGRNVTLLEEQSREFLPRLISFEGNERPPRSVISLRGAAWSSLQEMAVHPDVDIVVVATAGKAGLSPTLAALAAGKVVALANKEALVMAGKIVAATAARGRGEIRPIDSEHSAIWQCLRGEQKTAVSRLILTASGGAFRDKGPDELRLVTPEQALRHPTWQMGRKITVDSATLLNKGLEAIEARWLFDVPLDRIEIVMHRESVIHSFVEFVDGSLKAQLGLPDMRLPIQYALCYPERLPLPSLPRLDLKQARAFHFEKLDLQRYPCLGLALEAGHRGGSYPAVLAAADEVAVEHFLAGHIRFTDIPLVIEETLDGHDGAPDPGLEEIWAADAWARARAEDLVRAKA
ncbi:MAG: 1-deoxy-D-xylulose-5-phosphate reductoisomerase [Dehalococcoidia bacterium]|nr:1-deoxy-D-xylulose-5-phosphate reductoisomerase [Dehalococcoidia bacterium]